MPESVFDVVRSPGRPLDADVRSWFEPRMGHDLGRVRLHTDSAAAASARSVQALAYTVGRHIVFGPGHDATRSAAGRRLLAHELAHTVQQRGASETPASALEISSPGDGHEREADRVADRAVQGLAGPAPGMSARGVSIQRACGPVAIGEPEGCEPFGSVSTEQIFSVPAERFLFRVNCDEFVSAAERNRLRALAAGIGAADPVDIHGFASEEGDATYNAHLSCARAMRARRELIDAGLPEANLRGIFNHGATAFGARDVNRSVVIPLAEPPTLNIMEAGFIGPPRESDRRAAASCPIDCDGRTLGTMHAMGLFFHRSRGAILPSGDPTANGIGTSLHFTETAIDIPDTEPCHCDDYRIIQVITTTHPAAGRVSPYVDNSGVATPFYDAVFLSGEGIHEIPGGYPDAGERIQSTISIYDRPLRGTAGEAGVNIRWEAEACVTCIKNADPDRILGCATYGFATNWNAAAGAHDPVAGIGPGCGGAPTAAFLDALRTDPTTVGYDFEGR
ncbi:MAG: eCIS core domain-containing protein [Candidatus Rokuibacteriota bacterium]